MVLASKIILKLLRALILTLCACSLLLVILYWFLQTYSGELSQHFLSEFSKSSGLEIKTGAIDVTFFPFPGLTASELSISGRNMQMDAAWLLLRPSLPNILRGDFVPGKISILRPKLAVTIAAPLADPDKVQQQLKTFIPDIKNESSDTGMSITGCTLELVQGDIQINGENDSKLLIRSIDTQLDLYRDSIDGQLRIGLLRFNRGNGQFMAIKNFSLSGSADPLNFIANKSRLNTSGILEICEKLKNISFKMDYSGSSEERELKLALNGDLNLNRTALPLKLSGLARQSATSDTIELQAWQWQLDADSGEFAGALKLPQNPLDFSLSGNFRAKKVSLTQWLGFARNLAPGLQLALDNVLDVSIGFAMNAKGLQVPDINATCVGAVFTGKGSVADFSRPVVFLDLVSKQANLGLSIPESVGKFPKAPFFPYPTLTPLPGEPLKPGETGVDYDIRLASKKVKYGQINLQDAFLRIYPGKLDKSNGLTDTILDGKATLYGGKLTGQCVLGGDNSLPIAIKGKASQINGAQLAKAISGLPIRQGLLQMETKVTSRGKQLNTFLQNLNGLISVDCDKTILAGNDSPANIEANINLHGGFSDRSRVGFDGLWRMHLKDSSLDVNSEMDGRLWFGQNGLTFKNLQTKGAVKLEKALGLLPANTEIRASGIAMYDGGNAELNQAKIEMPDLTATGNIRVANGNSWQGALTAETKNLQNLLAKLQIKASAIPAEMGKIKLEAAFTGNRSQLRLTGIKGNIGPSNVSGSFAWQSKNGRPVLDFDLNLDRLNLEMLTDKTQQKNASASKGKWNLSFMKEFDAKGNLQINELIGWKVRMQKLHLPINLAAGKLSAGPTTAIFYGAELNSRSSFDFDNGISFNTVFAVHDFNLGALARDQELKGELLGKASLEANVKASFSGPGQMPSALNGQWSMAIRNGSWQSRNKNGALTGKPAIFELAKASGKIESGVLKSSNFVLTGPGMDVNGGGWLNLANQDIECNLTVNMRGLPEFPLKLYGSLGKTKTSIGAGKFVINAIGEITSGFVNILGGLAEGAWKIFR